MKNPDYNSYTWPKVPKVNRPKPIKGTSIRILGCGTSSGVPLLACDCKVCKSSNAKNKRTRASVYIQAGQKTFLIDTAPDLRNQAFRNNLRWIDAVLFTHPHADHIHGIDELRSFNYIMGRSIPCYGNEWTIDAIKTKFDYIFKMTQTGGGTPQISVHLIKKAMQISGVRVQPLELIHGRLPVLGYRINDIAYITDCSYIPDRTFKYLKGLQILVLDCLRHEEHPTHLNVESALMLAEKIGAKKTYFTHMGHDIEYKKFARELPKNMYPAYDGLVVHSK